VTRKTLAIFNSDPNFLSQGRGSCVLAGVTTEAPQAQAREAREAREARDPEEQQLVDGLRRGDAIAFDRAYATYNRRVFSFLLRLSGRRDTAEDLAQETWIKLAKAAPGLREDTRLGPLLFTIARNAFLSHRRWAMLDLSRLVTMGFETINAISSDPTPDMEHERARAIELLEAAIQALPLASREVLLLIGVEGLDQEEVAKILGVSYDALRQRLSRARTQLTEKMQMLESKSSKSNSKSTSKKPQGEIV
jgi:RNA polymerase sigma factor (sigma-70 family)